jgi:hypothetical protein
VGDLAKAVEVATRDETCEGGKALMGDIEGKTLQGGGPDGECETLLSLWDLALLGARGDFGR